MNDSTSNQLNENDLDYSSETNHADEFIMQTRCVMDENFVPKVGMIFKTLEEAGKFYKHYSKLAGFSTKIRNTTQKGDKVKNQLIICSREERWKSKISLTLKTNHSAGLNYPARIYVHIMKDVSLWTISKVVLNHSHPCYPDRAEMLKQHRELSMFVCCTIKTNEEAGIRPSKTYQSFVAAAGSHREPGSFVGVNHHGQSTLLGCTLMKNEDIQSFKWLFECWLHCMGASREQREREFDAADFHIVIPYPTKSVTEAQFQHVYTHEKFREVQAQFRGKMNCITRSMHFTLGFIIDEVVEQVSNSKFNKFFVTYDAVSQEVKCQCLLFESRGILCRHSLSVLSFKKVDNVAPKYILEYWSKNIKRRHTHIKKSQDEPLLEPRSKGLDDLVFWSHNICEFASESEELTEILHRTFDKVMVEMQEYQ
ncbi:protein FAR-RED IMPAIRED RESPONSE 1-like [Arachis stenosperma]|uniref:protein FAR-RED IMPAIRED RESPONSE 1-like n=1 Tax=Arachis stenosperma TaxID=217475 RepID=UPI0025AC9EE9|nr:protein FAR-RED IMPAIRED RESPONSE 1-like [Arachis stenosperma]